MATFLAVLQQATLLLGAVYAACTALGALFLLVGWAKGASAMGIVGVDIKKILDWIKKVPGAPAVVIAWATGVAALRLLLATALFVFALLGAAGCSWWAANGAKVLSVEQQVCTDVELASSLIPPGTPVSMVVADLGLVCTYTPDLVDEVTKIVTAFEAAQDPASFPAGAVYKPSPRMQRAKAARAAGH